MMSWECLRWRKRHGPVREGGLPCAQGSKKEIVDRTPIRQLSHQDTHDVSPLEQPKNRSL